MRTIVTAFAFAGLVACGSGGMAGDPSGDTAPTLQVDSPVRGTTVSGQTVTVSGLAFDDEGPVTVTVGGSNTPVGSDGSFSATVTLADGIDVIETHAIDSAGHDVRDVRAVLAGTLAPADGTRAAPIGTFASADTLHKIATTIATDAKAIDYTSVADALNPIYDNGGCLGATVNITSVTLSDVDVALTPATNALDAAVTISNVNVQLHASFKVACIGGSGTVTVTASAAHVSGNLGVSVADGTLTTSLPSPTVVLDNFNLSVSGIPSAVTGLFDGIVRGKVESALGNAIQTKVPGIANSKLAGLLAKPFNENVLGQAVALTVTPTAAKISPTGLFVGADTKVTVTGGTGGKFVTEATPAADTLMAQTQDLGLAIANDLLNQLLAGLWSAGAFDKTVPISTLSVLSALLDPNATQLVLKLSLPPTAATDANGNLQLAIGDAIISVQDASGTELQKIALSLQTALSISATPTGAIGMTLATPTVAAQVLGQVSDGSIPLTDAQVEGLATGAWGVISQQASSALAKLPLPTIAGFKLGDPMVDSVSNYVLADIPLQ